MNKLYIYRKYDQWRGKTIHIEDEVDGNGYYVQIPDLEMKRGSINIITVELEDSEGLTYSVACNVVDYDKRLVSFQIPYNILNNKGLYYAVFAVSYNANGGVQTLNRSAKQSFRILETIEVGDDQIQDDERYPILLSLINDLGQYKIDTSNFPTFEDMDKAIEEKLEDLSIEVILDYLENQGYITRNDVNSILSGKNYATKSDVNSILSGKDYATKSEVNSIVSGKNYATKSEVESILSGKLDNTLFDDFATKDELGKYVEKSKIESSYLYNYVKKQSGKGLSTHDLTDELYNKLLNLDENIALDEELLNKIHNSVTLDQVYTKAEIDFMLSNFTVSENKILFFGADKPTSNEIGDIINNITFSWGYQGVAQSIKLIGLDDEPIDVTSTTEYLYEGDILEDKTVTLEITFKDNTVLTKDINFLFTYQVYYGVGYNSEADIDSYAQIMYVDGDETEITLSFTAKNDKIFIAIPSRKGYAYKIVDVYGTNCYSSFDFMTERINGIEYNIQMLQHNTTCTDYVLTFYIGGDV